MDANILGAWITGGLGFAVALGTLLWQRWQGKEIERLKSQLQQHDFIHRLQFEKEFEIYDHLWKLIIEFSDEIAGFTVKAKGTKKLSDLVDDVVKLTQAISKFRDFVETHKPFFSEEIYSESHKLSMLVGSAINFGVAIHDGVTSDEIARQSQQISSDLKSVADNVCAAIRMRITVKK